MTFNQKKNLLVAALTALIIFYVLLSDYSVIGLCIAGVSVSIILLMAVKFNKEGNILSKIGGYIFCSTLAFLLIKLATFDDLLVSGRYFKDFALLLDLIKNGSLRFNHIVVCSLIAGGILLIIGKSEEDTTRKKYKIILNYTGICLSMFGIMHLNPIFPMVLFLVNICILILFAIIDFFNIKLINKFNKRHTIFSVIITILLIYTHTLFPDITVTQMSIKAFIYSQVLPWYNVLGLTLSIFAIVALISYFKPDSFFDEDTVLLSGLLGVVWVIKGALHYYSDLYCLIIISYVCFWIAFMNLYIKRHIPEGSKPKINELILIFITAIGAVLASIFIAYGYLMFFISALLSLVIILNFYNIFKGWLKDYMFWQVLLLCILISGYLYSINIGYSEKKTVVMIAIFIVTSFVMWILNYNNQVGDNEFRVVKPTVVIIFSILIFMTVLKAGSRINIEYFDINGSAASENAMIKITAKADGKHNSITSLKYLWSNSLLYDKNLSTVAEGNMINLAVEASRLIVWAVEANGVTTKSERWFYNNEQKEDFDIQLLGINLIQSINPGRRREIRILINGKKVNFTESPVNLNGAIFVSFQEIAEKLNCAFIWDETSEIAYINMNTSMEIFERSFIDGNIIVFVENTEIDFGNQRPVLINGYLMLPIRNIVENLNCTIEWEEATQTVHIYQR